MGKCLFMRKGETHTSPIAGLPSGYTKLTYIESTGTQYIDTGFKPNQDTRVDCDFQFTSASGLPVIFGAWNSGSDGMLIFQGGPSLTKAYCYYGNTSYKEATVTLIGRHTVRVNSGKFYLDGALISEVEQHDFSCNYPLALFAYNSFGSIAGQSSAKLYSCQIYDNGTLVRDFLPCINLSGEIGLYDTVNKKFYGNAGTGYFSGMDLDGNEVTASVLLSTIAEGSIVKVNENGSPVEFYVAKHDYEPTLNGTGRILLVRKNSYGDRAWDDDGNSKNTYATSDIDTWLNGTYKNLFDEKVKSAMGETAIRYTQGNGQFSVSTLSRSVFLPSLTEIGATANDGNCNTEGSRLPIYSKLWLGTNYWTRSPYCVTVYAQVYYWHANNKKGDHQYSYQQFGCLPCFTLPATSVFDADTLVFKRVA